MPALQAAASSTEAESRAWVRDLRAGGATADEAAARLHALLLRTARFEVARRGAERPLPAEDGAQLAVEAARDALTKVHARLDDFRDDRRFTTWAAKFAVLETAVRLRRRAWERREPAPESGLWNALVRLLPADENETVRTLHAGIVERLTPTQRRVFVALAVDGVPIDVLAERLDTTRGELYAVLRSARSALRQRVAPAVSL